MYSTTALVLLLSTFAQVHSQELEGWHTSKDCTYIRNMNRPLMDQLITAIGPEANTWTLNRFALRKNYCYQGMAVVGEKGYYRYIQIDKIKFIGLEDTVQILETSVPLDERNHFTDPRRAAKAANKYAKKHWLDVRNYMTTIGEQRNSNEKSNLLGIVKELEPVICVMSYACELKDTLGL